jgi:hypothetical protein
MIFCLLPGRVNSLVDRFCRPFATAEPSGKQKSKPSKAPVKKGVAQDIPPCTCGAPRVFEFQLLPSVLHVLEVDQHAVHPAASDNNTPATSLEAAYAQSGMNFGNIAVYTCSKTCGVATEEYVVIQDSVDEAPVQRRGVGRSIEPVVIEEGTKFDEDDGVELCAMIDDDDADDMEAGVDDVDDDDAFEPMTEDDPRF